MDTTAATNTPDMYEISESGMFTFNTNCRVRSTPDMSDSGVATYKVNQSVSYNKKVKNGNHLWLVYTGASGALRYVPYANTDTGKYFGQDSNAVDPIKVTTGGNPGTTGSTTGNPGSTTGGLGSLRDEAGAAVAKQTPERTTWQVTGTFTFGEPAAGRMDALMAAPKVGDSFKAGESVYYVAKIKNDGHYWLQYSHYGSGTYYVPYATISPFRNYIDGTGNDTTPGNPVYPQGSTTGGTTGGSTGGDTGNTGSSTTGSRPQGGQDTGYPNFESSGNFDFDIDYDSMPSHGVITLVDNGAYTRHTPLMSNSGITHYKKGSSVTYYSKKHADGRIWVTVANGDFLPIGKLTTPITIERPQGEKYSRFSYSKDSNRDQPWDSIWPYTTNETDNDDRVSALMHEDPKAELVPTAIEQSLLDSVKAKVDAVSDQDAVTFGFMTDSHFSSYKNPSTARVLRSMKTMSYYAKHYGLDLMIHGGDLNDGVTEKKYELEDVKRAMDALKLGQRPLLVAQGNHDDDSGYARDFDGYYPRNIITNSEVYPYRFGTFAHLLDTQGNTNNKATYGKYKVPNSKLNIILLDGFDQSDNYTTPIKYRRDFRHGWMHFSQQQQNWLQSTLNSIPNDEYVLVVTHIMFKGLSWSQPNTFAEALLDKQAAPGTLESANIRQMLVNYKNRTNHLVAVLGGHTHLDDYSNQFGVNWIVTTCAISDRGDGSSDRSIGTVSEQAWDIYVFNPSSHTLNRIRYGWHNEDARRFSSRYTF